MEIIRETVMKDTIILGPFDEYYREEWDELRVSIQADTAVAEALRFIQEGIH